MSVLKVTFYMPERKNPYGFSPAYELTETLQGQVQDIINGKYEDDMNFVGHDINCGCNACMADAHNRAEFWGLPFAPSKNLFKYVDPNGKK